MSSVTSLPTNVSPGNAWPVCGRVYHGWKHHGEARHADGAGEGDEQVQVGDESGQNNWDSLHVNHDFKNGV